MGASLWIQEIDLCVFLSLSTLFCETGSYIEPGFHRFGKTGYAGLPMCSKDPNVSTFLGLSLYMCVEDTQFGPQVWCSEHFAE